MLASAQRTRRGDRCAVLAGLAGITTLAWVYLVDRAAGMSGMSEMGEIARLGEWTPRVFTLTLLMWVVMMIGMMVPTATPMTLVFAAVARKARNEDNPLPSTFVFVAGYVLVWTGFSVAATTAQLFLERAALLSSEMVSTSTTFGGALLVSVGIYQLTPFKQACLRHCRAPAHFLAERWRSGTVGVFAMGARAGAYCLGCCWLLMVLLFVGGVMNLLWVATIAFFVLVEKVLPFGELGARLVGAAMILTGTVTLVGAVGIG